MYQKGIIFTGAIFTVLLLISVIPVYSQGVDTSYAPVPGPGTPVIKALALQSDGKAIIAGSFQTINAAASPTIARLNTDGTLDTSFSPGTGFNGNVTKLLVQSDGKILVLGTFTTYNSTARAGIARLNSDGSLDTSFTPTISNVKNMALLPGDNILLLGTTIFVDSVARTGLARMNTDGTLDTSFLVLLGDPDMHDCVVHPDGRITAVGSFNGLNGNNSRINSVRLMPDGSVDPTFQGLGVQVFHRLALQPDGKYITASTIGVQIWRWTANGGGASAIDPTFNSGNVRSIGVESINIEQSGSIILGGSFTAEQRGILRLSSTGERDVAFAFPGANGDVNGVAIQADNKTIAVGAFTSIAGVAKPGMARLNSTDFAAKTPFDFDGDGKADISVTRTTDLFWYRFTGPSYVATQFGASGDTITPADYDGDGKTDIAVFHPATGDWRYLSSRDNVLVVRHFTQGPGEIPLPGDYTGDGRPELVLVRNYQWQIVDIVHSQVIFTGVFGASGDDLVPGDYDGDGKIDKAVFRRATGQWLYYPSSAGGGIEYAFHWGNSSDIPVPADYDGDNKTDFAVYRASEGNWYVLNSSNGSYLWQHFGISTDRPIPADYDGDGKADIAVYRPSEGFWYLLQTTAGYTGYRWGLDIDIPTPAAYVPAP